MYKKIIKALFEAKVNRSINESYATVKERFIKDGADKAEVKTLLDLHKKLKDMRRLKDNEINIDVLAKGKTFDEFKSLMSRYSEKDTTTKTDKFNELKNNIVAENDEWIVYKINSAEKAYLFHGLTKWCIVSGSKSDAEKYFDHYVFKEGSNFYFIVRKNTIGDKWDYIALQLQQNGKTYWDKEDNDHKSLPNELNIPKLVVKYEPVVRAIPNSWKLNSDGTYNVNDDVDLKKFEQFVDSNRKLTIKFNKVTGDFVCNTLDLTSLEGCPEKVGGDFKCYTNKLTSLKGAPKEVGGNFDCGFNNLTSLEGAPKEVGGNFDCSFNNLTSLEGCPEKIGGNVKCYTNKLTSLKGAPKEVIGDFDCSDNKLTSLEGCPKKVGGVFYFENNKGKRFTKSEVEKVCKVGNEIYV